MQVFSLVYGRRLADLGYDKNSENLKTLLQLVAFATIIKNRFGVGLNHFQRELIKMKYDDLALELQTHVNELSKRDSTLDNAVFWELVYSDVSEKVDDDLTKMYLLNRHMVNIGLGGLRVIRNPNKPNCEGDYYTINGAQFILSIKVPELPVSGLVYKKTVDFDEKNGVSFSERTNILDKFCASKNLSKSNVQEFKDYLIKCCKVENAVALILSDEAMEAAKDYVLRHKICFQAKWNGLEAAKALLS